MNMYLGLSYDDIVYIWNTAVAKATQKLNNETPQFTSDLKEPQIYAVLLELLCTFSCSSFI